MKQDEAIQSIAFQLKARAEADLHAAKRMMGDRAEIQLVEVNYEDKAAQLLDEAVYSMAHDLVTKHLNNVQLQPSAPLPPPPAFKPFA